MIHYINHVLHIEVLITLLDVRIVVEVKAEVNLEAPEVNLEAQEVKVEIKAEVLVHANYQLSNKC